MKLQNGWYYTTIFKKERLSKTWYDKEAKAFRKSRIESGNCI